MSNVRYLSRRSALGDVSASASDASSYAAYARAIYQAINGDVVGGAYNAAITIAGPYAAIGNAIANFLNRKGDRDDALLNAFRDALVNDIGFGEQIYAGKFRRFVTPDGSTILAASGNDQLLAVARAIGNGMPADFVGQKFKEWLATGTPWTLDNSKGWTYIAAPRALPPPIVSATITPPAAPIASTPTATVAPTVVTPVTLAMSDAQPFIAAPASATAAPASIDPRTAALVSQLMQQGASANQAYVSALQSLSSRGIPATPAVHAGLASAVNANVTQIPKGVWIVLGIVAVFGIVYVVRN